MPDTERKSFDSPDETREFDKGQLALVNVGDSSLGRAILQPGWRWSESIKPIVNTESCEAPHTGCVISGRMHVVMDDGTEIDFGPGDALWVAPGHDAWVVGDQPFVGVDFTGAAHFAEQ